MIGIQKISTTTQGGENRIRDLIWGMKYPSSQTREYPNTRKKKSGAPSGTQNRLTAQHVAEAASQIGNMTLRQTIATLSKT
jgi:hypothetical protein